MAALFGKTDTVALLVKSGANVNMKDNVSTVVLPLSYYLCISCIHTVLLEYVLVM